MSQTRLVQEAENRLSRFNSERERIVTTVSRRVIDRLAEAAERSEEHSLEYALNEVAFNEIRRYEKSKSRAAQKKLSKWRELASQLGRMSEDDKRRKLEDLVTGYSEDVAGNFNPKVYRFANDVLPPALSFLLAPIASVRDGIDALGSMASQVRVEGPLDKIRAAADRGTLVFAPTHSSNLDSIVLGFGLNRAKLPPVTYGAGKNLFSNPLISFFMHNLGAYRVDRRLKFGLYKDVLKEYSTVLLERGFHSLFFPGGTRSRSNFIEQKLKLGLLGTALTAYGNCLRTESTTRRIYVVPVTINYRLILEAETLIEDYLEETGKSRYIIEDDEFSRVGRVVEFLRKLLAHGSAVVLNLSDPIDVFGNETDDEGNSLDERGRILDPAKLMAGGDGAYRADPQRDSVYTRRCGRKVAACYQRGTLYLSTHVVARALFERVKSRSGVSNLYQILRLPPSSVAVPRENVLTAIDQLRDRIEENPRLGALDRTVAEVSSEEILADGLRSLGTYHTRPVAESIGANVRVGYMKLLYYYANRSAHLIDATGGLS